MAETNGLHEDDWTWLATLARNQAERARVAEWATSSRPMTEADWLWLSELSKRPARKTSPAMTTAELVAAVKSHAVAHYANGGWDVVVECWSDADIADGIGRARTLPGAIRKLSAVVDVFADREAGARNAGGW